MLRLIFSKLKILLALAVVATALPARSSEAGPRFKFQQDSLSLKFEMCWNLFEKKQYDQAATQLSQLTQLEPPLVDPARGSAYYLFGRTLQKKSLHEAAFDTLKSGLAKLAPHNLFDVFLADEFVRSAIQLEKENDYEKVTIAFNQILEHARFPIHESILSRIYGQCEFLIADGQKKEFKKFASSEAAAEARPGNVLRQFWRAKDATPVTVVNERLIEHLVRVEHSVKFYSTSLPRGFDDRGVMYVKLGKPSGIASAGISGRDIRSNYSFKPNEVWFYTFIDPELYFPFVHMQDKRGYVLVDGIEKAITGNIVATKWRSALPRGGIFSDSLGRGQGMVSDTPEIDARIYFYKQLAAVSPIFFERVNELEGLLLERQYALMPLTASYYSQIAVSHMNSIDYRDDSFREQVTPPEVSTILSMDPLPLVYRTARFLEADSSTRVEIYLGLRKRDLYLQEDLRRKALVLKMSATVENDSLWPATAPETSIMLPTFDAQSDSARNSTVIEILSIKTRLDTFYVSGEVGVWLASVSQDESQIANADSSMPSTNIYLRSEKLRRLAAFRSGQQISLSRGLGRDQHFMSDLQLSRQIIPRGDARPVSKDRLIIQPYPFHLVDRKSPIFLYFEVYGLKILEGATNYRVAYEAEQIDKKENIWQKVKSLLGSKQGGNVELESEYIGDSPNIIEWIGLDLNALAPGAVRLSVTIKDLHTGKTAKRSVDFDLI